MINWNGIILTSVFTIMGGVIVFCTSQIVLKFFIEPIQKERIGENHSILSQQSQSHEI